MQGLKLEPAEVIEVPMLLKDGALAPYYATAGAAGADLSASLATPLTLEPGKSGLVPTGLLLALPMGYEAQVRPRSGLALRHGITVLNTPGTIDADYRGEVGVILINHGNTPFMIEPGMRIAQLVIQRVVIATFKEAKELPATERGAGGYSHTGLYHDA